MTTTATTKNTTVKTTLNPLAYAVVMQSGLSKLRAGAIQTVLTIAAYTLTKGEQMTRLECAQLRGNDIKKMPSEKSEDINDRRIVNTAKKDVAISGVIIKAKPELKPIFVNLITGLNAHLESAEKFEAEAINIIDTLGFFAGSDITSQKDVLDFFESYHPETKNAPTEDSAPTEAEAEAEAPTEAEKEAAKKRAKEDAEKRAQAAEMANDAIELLIAENPTLSAVFAEAEKVTTKQEAVALIGQAFNEQLKAANAELETLRKINTKTPRKTTAKKPTNKAMADALEKANA